MAGQGAIYKPTLSKLAVSHFIQLSNTLRTRPEGGSGRPAQRPHCVILAREVQVDLRMRPGHLSRCVQNIVHHLQRVTPFESNRPLDELWMRSHGTSGRVALAS
jgi:hypothetical protein